MRLIISDLDGTLYPKKGENVQERKEANFEAVRKWVNAGNQFVAATARGLHHYHVLQESLGFPPNFIGSNGAEVRLANGEEIHKSFPCKVFIDLHHYLLEHNINATLATGIDNDWVWSRTDIYPRGNPSYAKYVDTVTVADFDTLDPNIPLQRLEVFTPPENRDILKKAISELNYPVSLTTSDADLIDVGPLECSKGISILELCKRYGVEPKDLIVIGDSENDIPMFELTENSYCIDTAEKHVLHKASHVVPSVAYVIEELLNS